MVNENTVATVEADEVDDDVVEPARVIPPELSFTTPDRDETPREGPDTLEFQLDGETYTIVVPHKLEEAICRLIEAGARRATTADALYAGAEFMRKVLHPDSAYRLQRRLDDDSDPFRLEDLYDILEKIVKVLDNSLVQPERRPTRAGARARGRR